MMNLFRNTAVTSVSVLPRNCEILYPEPCICIFYSKANKSKLKNNSIFIDIWRNSDLSRATPGPLYGGEKELYACSQIVHFFSSFDLFYGNLFSPQCTIEWRLAASCNQRSSKKMLFNVQRMHFI